MPHLGMAHAKEPASLCHRLGFPSLTKSLGVEHFTQVVGGQGVHCQDAFIGKAPLAAGDESCQELAVCRNVAAGIIVDFAVLHQHIHGGYIRQREKKVRKFGGDGIKNSVPRNLGAFLGPEPSLELLKAALSIKLKCHGTRNTRETEDMSLLPL